MARRTISPGMQFGRLTAIRIAQALPRKWLCKCECGKEVAVVSGALHEGNTRSCGCLKLDILNARTRTHGLSTTPLYGVWNGMMGRCYRPRTNGYHNYGGRGISVCPEWHDPARFAADMGLRPPGGTLERRDNDKGYSPENCCWRSIKEQLRHTSQNVMVTFGGKTQCAAAWSEELGLAPGAILGRLKRGWTAERAITQPVIPRQRRMREAGVRQ